MNEIERLLVGAQSLKPVEVVATPNKNYIGYVSSDVTPNSSNQLEKSDARMTEKAAADERVHNLFNQNSWMNFFGTQALGATAAGLGAVAAPYVGALMTPSTYLDVIGAPAWLGTAANLGTSGYFLYDNGKEFIKDPSLYNGVMTALSAIPMTRSSSEYTNWIAKALRGASGGRYTGYGYMGNVLHNTPLTGEFNSALPLNVGWGPRQTFNVSHKSNSASPLSLYNENRWDVTNEGANPFGVWYQGLLGTARPTAKAGRARSLFDVRPYTHSGELTLDKPLITVGEVPNRSTLSYLAEQLGADGLVYNGVYDNGYDGNQVILSFRNPENRSVTARAYKGGDRTSDGYEFFTTDPEYAQLYGPVTAYDVKMNNPVVTDTPLMGSSDIVTLDIFYNDVTKGNNSVDAIVGHDLVTGELPYTSKGDEIMVLNPNQAVPTESNELFGFGNISASSDNIANMNRFIQEDIYPRLTAQGHDVSKTHIPTLRMIDPKNDYLDAVMVNRNASAWYHTLFDDATFRISPNNVDFGTLLHEVGGHGIRFNLDNSGSSMPRSAVNDFFRKNNYPIGTKLPNIDFNVTRKEGVFNNSERNLLSDAYSYVAEHPNLVPYPEKVIQEQGAVNTLFRAKLSAANGHVVGKLLDEVIKNTPSGEILKMEINLPYTSSIIKEISNITGISSFKLLFKSPEELTELAKKYPKLNEIVNKAKEAMMKVGIFSGGAYLLNNQQKQ